MLGFRCDSHFLSFCPLPSADVTITDSFVVLLFLHFFPLLQSFLLVCFFSPVSLLCTYYTLTSASLLHFLWWMWHLLVFLSLFQLCFHLPFCPPHFLVFPSTHLFVFSPVVNVLISSSGDREEPRLNCRMANHCSALIAILNSVFRNNQIRESVSVCVCVCFGGRAVLHVPVGECVFTRLK